MAWVGSLNQELIHAKVIAKKKKKKIYYLFALSHNNTYGRGFLRVDIGVKHVLHQQNTCYLNKRRYELG